MILGIVGPSAVVPEIELSLGVQKLSAAGFTVRVHPHLKKRHLFFAGTDEQRAKAFFDYASDPKIAGLWFARGGYGAMRLLPYLAALTRKHGKPKLKPKSASKLLIGSSDATALLDFVRSKWGWKTLHAPMPATQGFQKLSPRDWQDLLGQIQHFGKSEPMLATLEVPLKFVSRGKLKTSSVRGELVGGNLAVLCSLVGTPYALNARGKILFLEDVTEAPYRLDRMLQQMLMAGAFRGVKAIVIGSLHQCEDTPPQVYAEVPHDRGAGSAGGVKMKPLRRALSAAEVLAEVFGGLGKTLGIPVAYGLTVGHGPAGMACLPLGVQYELTAKGKLRLR